MSRNRSALKRDLARYERSLTTREATRQVRADEPIAGTPGEVVEVVTTLDDGRELPIARVLVLHDSVRVLPEPEPAAPAPAVEVAS